VDDLGLTHVRFANGVTLTIKPTQFRIGEILVNVRAGEGRLGLPHDHMTPAWALSGAFVSGGLRRYTIDDLRKRMADKRWGAALTVSEDEFNLSGQARPTDLDAELQVLAAYVTDPAWSASAFDQVRVADAGIQEQTESSPSSLLSRELFGRLHDGDARWRAPTMTEIVTSKVDDAKAILSPALSLGPLDITMVGDVTVDQAIQSVAVTFGALPARPAPGGPAKGDERFPGPTPEPVVLTHHGAVNQAVAAIAWPTTGFFPDMKLQRTLRTLSEIFAQRLLDELRTREGITYTPGAATYSSVVSPDFGFLYALAQVPPDKIANFYAEAASIAADLQARPVGADELDRARGPRIQDIQKQQQSNDYWLSLLAGSQQDPRLLDIIRSTIPDLKSITPADVQKAAQDYLKPETAYRIVVVPQGTAPPRLQP
jgi:zinc protease